MSDKPTQEQIKAVRGVLYKRSRVRAIRDSVSSIDVLLGLAPSTQTGSGPAWIIPATGKLDPAVLAAAGYARRIAADLREMSSEIGKLSLPSSDQNNLMGALEAQAAAWAQRAAAWVQTTRPSAQQIKTTVTAISNHERDATDAAKKVRVYLSGDDQLNMDVP
jgi:hypothetical protein